MRASNPIEERVLELIEPDAAAMGYRIVRARLSGLKRKRLQIMAERASDGLMDLDDCEQLSHAVSALLDAHDPIQGEYDLELSSPGIDRPLVRIEDFARFAGHEAKLETIAMIEGRRRFKGALLAPEGERVRIAIDGENFEIPFSQLADARLVLTERLIQEDLKRSKAAAEQEKRTAQ